jgi:hypothetical protein
MEQIIIALRTGEVFTAFKFFAAIPLIQICAKLLFVAMFLFLVLLGGYFLILRATRDHLSLPKN